MTQKNSENIYKALKEEERTLLEKKCYVDGKSFQEKRRLRNLWECRW